MGLIVHGRRDEGDVRREVRQRGGGRPGQCLRRGGGLGRGAPSLTSASWPGPAGPTSRCRPSRMLGADAVPNLLALGEDGRGVYLPAHVRAVSLPLSAGRALRCASLPGLRRELAELAERWDLPLDDEGLKDLLRVHRDPDDGWVADAPEILAFARLALAANEAVRRDCPLWLVGAI